MFETLNEAVHMPTYMRSEISSQTFSYEHVCLLLLAHTIQYETLHGHRLAMIGRLWIVEDLFGQFEAHLVLLVVVALQDLLKYTVLFGR